MNIYDIIYTTYAYLFGKRIFKKFNSLLYNLGLRGLGVLNYQNEYLIGEKRWVKRYLKNKANPVVVDVGANVGLYSKYVLSCNPTCKVFAFEPHPITYKKLISNIDSKNFQAFNFAVGHEKGMLELYDYDTKEGSSHASLYKEVIQDLHQGNPVSYSVNVITLDDFFKEHELEFIDLLKIDTEGNEFNVLLGCKELLNKRKIKAIQFEFNEMNIVSKVSFKNFWDYLKDYELYRILAGGRLLKIESYAPIACEIYAFQNIVAILRGDY